MWIYPYIFKSKIEFTSVLLMFLNSINFGVKTSSYPYDFVPIFFVIYYYNTSIHAGVGGSRPNSCVVTAWSPHAAPRTGHVASKFSPVWLQWIICERIWGILVYYPILKGFSICFKCFSPVASNKVRNRGKRSLHFENEGIKSQGFKNEDKNTIGTISRGILV